MVVEHISAEQIKTGSKKRFASVFVAAFLLIQVMLSAQEKDRLTLQEVYRLSRENYPLVKQRDLIRKSGEYTLDNAGKAYLPLISINGQASYQSTVTSLPIKMPGLDIPVVSKDQYRLYAEVNQPLYDGGLARRQKELIKAGALAEEQKLEVELYQLRERVEQLFFGILISESQLRQIELLVEDLNAVLKKTEAAVSHGIALKSNAAQLKAEILRAGQRATEIRASRKAYLQMLGQFINRELGEQTALATPEIPQPSAQISRPELLLLEQSARIVALQNESLTSRNRPRLNFFIQGGYGRPALNMLSNEFEPYYIGGLRLNWNLGGLYTIKKDRAINDLSRQNIDVQKQLFLFNTGVQLKQQDTELEKLRELLRSDDEIIGLRREIKQTSAAQLDHGIINASDYLREVNAEQQAIESKMLHEIQLLMTAHKKETINGSNSSQ